MGGTVSKEVKVEYKGEGEMTKADEEDDLCKREIYSNPFLTLQYVSKNNTMEMRAS